MFEVVDIELYVEGTRDYIIFMPTRTTKPYWWNFYHNGPDLKDVSCLLDLSKRVKQGVYIEVEGERFMNNV